MNAVLEDQKSVQSLNVIYQLPLLLEQDAKALSPTEPIKKCWEVVSLAEEYDLGHRTFFHRFCGQPIFGDSKGERAEFDTFRRVANLPAVSAKGTNAAPNVAIDILGQSDNLIWMKRVFAVLRKVELRVASKTAKHLGLAILSVEMEFTSIQTFPTQQQTHKLDENKSIVSALLGEDVDPERAQALTLGDAQLVLEYVRRVYSRRWSPYMAFPFDVPMQVHCNTGPGWTAIPIGERSDTLEAGAEHQKLLPWVEALLNPLPGLKHFATDANTRVFDEDRAYMFSCVQVSVPEGETAGSVVASISDGDLHRLAEADAPNNQAYPYAKPWVKQNLKQILYDRHAPDVDMAGPERATRYLFTDVHFCAVTAGPINVWGNIKRYYRHMQFMCIFEIAAMLVFSKRITETVRDAGNGTLDQHGFSQEIARLRREFLNITHVHHFTNVSNQIQPREMFAQMAEATGALSYHKEVEEEIRTASDYALSVAGLEQARAANRLQDILSIGVPVGIWAGALEPWYTWSSTWLTIGGNSLAEFVLRGAAVTALVFIGWAALLWSTGAGSVKTEDGERFLKGLKASLWIGGVAFVLIGAIAIWVYNRGCPGGFLVGSYAFC